MGADGHAGGYRVSVLAEDIFGARVWGDLAFVLLLCVVQKNEASFSGGQILFFRGIKLH